MAQGLPPLKTQGSQVLPARPSTTLWALRPAGALWNRLPSLSTAAQRAQFHMSRLNQSQAAQLITWSPTNVLAIASSEPSYCPPKSSTSELGVNPSLAWPVYIILPDHPNDVYTVTACDQPIQVIEWNEEMANTLVVATTSLLQIFAPSLENTLNVYEEVYRFSVKKPLLCKWIHVPVKHKVETPNQVWTEAFSLGRKFSPDKLPAMQPSPYAKTACLTLTEDGTIVWTYMEALNMKWTSVTAHLLKNGRFSHCDFCFTSCVSARVLVVPISSPNVVLVYDITMDYPSQTITTHPYASRLEIPLPPSEASSFFRHASATSTFTPPCSSVDYFSMSSPTFNPSSSNNTSGSSSNSSSTSTTCQDDSPHMSFAHLEANCRTSAIQHVAFDPFDQTVIYVVFSDSKLLSNGQRSSVLQRWKATTQSLKFKVPFDISRFIELSETVMTMETHSHQNPTENSATSYNSIPGLADYDDLTVGGNMAGDFNEEWGFNDAKQDQNPDSDPTAFTSVPSGAPVPQHDIIEDASSVVRNSSLVTDVWDCTARSSILASTFVAPGSSESAGTQLFMDSVTRMKCGRNVVTLSMLSGSTLVIDSDTLDVVVDYVAPHASPSQKEPNSEEDKGSTSHPTSDTSTSSSSATNFYQQATKKRSLDQLQTGPLSPTASLTNHNTNGISSASGIGGGLFGQPVISSPSADSPLFSPYSPSLGYDFGGLHSPTPKRRKLAEDDVKGSIDLASHLPPALGSLLRRPVSEGGFTAMFSSNIPVDCCLSPNQGCAAVLYADFSVRVFHLSPLLRYRTHLVAPLTPQQLCMQVVNLFEVAMLKRRSFWDVVVLLLALPEDGPIYNQQQLHRGVLILLSRDIDRLEQKGATAPSYYRLIFEQVKIAIFRSSPDMAVNWTRAQSLLSLQRIITHLSTVYRCQAYLKRISELPLADPQELQNLFSASSERFRDRSKFEKERTPSPHPPTYWLRWIHVFTVWYLNCVAGCTARLKVFRLKKDSASIPSSLQGSTSALVTAEPTIMSSGQSSSHMDSAIMSPHTTEGTNATSQSSTATMTPGGGYYNIQTPNNAIHTPGSTHAIHTPGGSNLVQTPTATTPGSVAHSLHSATARSNPPRSIQPSSGKVPLSIPSWFAQLPIVPETLEELMMIMPDANADAGLFWLLDRHIITLLREAVLLFAVSLYLDTGIHTTGVEYIKSFVVPFFHMLDEILKSPTIALTHSPTRYISDDWILTTVIPSFYSFRDIALRPTYPDISNLDLAPARTRFLEMNFFASEALDPSTLPTRDGKPLSALSSTDLATSSSGNTQSGAPQKAFFHAAAPSLPQGTTPDCISMDGAKGEFIKRCVTCNRSSNLQQRPGSGSEFTKSCPVCGSAWYLIGPFPPPASKREVQK